jgi:predicted TIM-barrel fold metal-dependent hydrolase
MVTRRDLLKAGAAAGVVTSRVGRAFADMPAPTTAVDFDVPPGSCDCHVHVFPDPAEFPFSAGRGYTPPTASPKELLRLQEFLHLDRVVIVTPSVYATDNRATLAGMRELGPQRARGIAVIDDKTSTETLDEMQKAGVRGVRINLEQAGVFDPAAASKKLEATVSRVKDRGWHVQMYTRLAVLAALADQLANQPVPLVFDHFGGARAELGTQQPGFDTLVALVRSGKAYVKISGSYRASDKAPDYPDVAPLAKALIAANAERIVWGSDWPHPDAAKAAGRDPIKDIAPPLPIDDGRVLNLLPTWTADAATRRKILVENPARLYGFAPA